MHRFSLRQLSLTRQLLVLQLLLVVVVLVAVGAVGFAQSRADYRATAGNRTLALAETTATDRLVRSGLLASPVQEGVLAGAATRTQTISGATYVLITSPTGEVLAAQDPTALGTRWVLSPDVLSGRAWDGESSSFGGSAIEAQVPVLDPDTAGVLGYAVVGLQSPGLRQQLRTGIGESLLYLVLASGFGVAGSILLARRIKRQTLGLEPRDIAGLVEHREALLHGIREGVVGLDERRRVTLVNDEAAALLDLPADVVGRPVAELDLEDSLRRTLLDPAPISDVVISTGTRLVSISQMPVTARGRTIGTVLTLRDRTQLAGLQRELDVTRRTADSLRAQAHEFTNRLHTIAGLIHIDQADRAVDYITGLNAAHDQMLSHVTSRVADPTLAALLVAKTSVAAEAGVDLVLEDGSHLEDVGPAVAADLETIIGNFLDNALEAVQTAQVREPVVELLLRQTADRVDVRVRDTGPGIDSAVLDGVFERGVTSKVADRADHGIGLSLAQLVCQRRGGGVAAGNDERGAVFTAWFPLTAQSSASRDRNDH